MRLQDVAGAGDSAATVPQRSHLRYVAPVLSWSAGVWAGTDECPADVVGTFRAATKQVHTTHSARVRVGFFPARGVTGVCETYASGS